MIYSMQGVVNQHQAEEETNKQTHVQCKSEKCGGHLEKGDMGGMI